MILEAALFLSLQLSPFSFGYISWCVCVPLIPTTLLWYPPPPTHSFKIVCITVASVAQCSKQWWFRLGKVGLQRIWGLIGFWQLCCSLTLSGLPLTTVEQGGAGYAVAGIFIPKAWVFVNIPTSLVSVMWHMLTLAAVCSVSSQEAPGSEMKEVPSWGIRWRQVLCLLLFLFLVEKVFTCSKSETPNTKRHWVDLSSVFSLPLSAVCWHIVTNVTS